MSEKICDSFSFIEGNLAGDSTVHLGFDDMPWENPKRSAPVALIDVENSGDHVDEEIPLEEEAEIFPIDLKKHLTSFIRWIGNASKTACPFLSFKEPLALSRIALDHLKILTEVPMGERDYYFALSRKGQLLLVYQDLDSDKYFLQGHFN